MPTKSVPITFGGEELSLLADRAVYWPARQTLLVADLHLGKDASFRVAGLPVPAGKSTKDLSRIDALIDSTGATRLVVLGDLVHGRTSHQPELAETFTRWRASRKALEILLIRGNHDRAAGLTPADWAVREAAEPFDDGPLTFTHHGGTSDRPHLCGHVHPVVALRDFDRSRASLPCFVIDPMQLMLPAFGAFTGGFKIKRGPERRIFAVAGDVIVPVP